MSWHGHFYDGKSAARQDVVLTISGTALVIRGPAGPETRWPIEQLRWIEPPGRGGSARIACGDNPGRLAIADLGLVAALRSAYPAIDRAAARHSGHGRMAVIAATSVVALAGLIYVVATFLPVIAAPLVPASVQRAIGEAAIDQIVKVFGTLEKKESRVCDGRAGQAAIDRLVDRLVPEGDPDRRLKVTVVDLKMVNALAAPGAQLLVFRGMIDFVGNPDEFAGVLAHELGHALHLHPTRGIIREIGIASTLGILTGSAGGQGLAGSAANVLVRTTYSRDAEREADDTAVDLLTRAGMTTEGMVTLFDRFAKKMPEFPEAIQAFSTHPRSADRARHIKERGASTGGHAMTRAEWQAVTEMCGG